MTEFEITLRFESSDDRETVMGRLRSFELPDGQVIEDASDVHIALRDAATTELALARAMTIVRAACDGTDVSPDRVGLSASVWPGS